MTQDTTGIFRKPGLIAAALAMVAVPPAQAADASPGATINVQYTTPETFSDVGDNGRVTTDARRDALLAQLTRHIQARAASRVPPGSTLAVTITDIDMAGDFEPWRGPRLDHVRIVKDIYPPRIKLEFRLAGADGKVITEGRRELTDLSFMTNMEYRSDLLRHEKKLLDDWLARELTGPALRHAGNR